MIGFKFGGPLGAAIGAGIGAIAGGLRMLFGAGGGKEKRHDAEIANQGFAQLRQIKEDYERQRRDFTSAIDAMNGIWQQMDAAFIRNESRRDQRRGFDIMLAQVRQIEDERNRRRQLLSLMAPPEFQAGGLVLARPSQPRGAIPAWLHEGEFVMNPQAVKRWGLNLLDGLNRGTAGPSAAAGPQISIEPASAQTLGEMLKRNPQALEEGLLVVLRRGGPASRALRG
ncbi:MAG: hypothetical protein HY316_10435 [Acidobacteria bacterium]|nr:hypothetical protein [Acidobacteriota bacterium]